MKQRWIFRIFGIALALLCISCTGFFEIEGTEKTEPLENPNALPTQVVFNNPNAYPVGIFSSSSRTTSITTVVKQGSSSPLSWVATNADGYTFYLTYYFDVEGARIPFVPPVASNAGFVTRSIKRNDTTQVQLPALTEYVQPTQRLSSDIWISVKNTGISQANLLNWTTILSQEDNKGMYIQPGETGLYKLTTNNPSLKILMGASEIPLPTITFQQGNLYILDFNGQATTLRDTKELILGNF